MMKQFFLSIFLISAYFTVNAQNYQTLQGVNGSKMYTGFITDNMLVTDTSFKWFGEAQKVYTPKESVVKKIAANKDSIRFLIFMGTWCEDSHFIIPRFFKTLDAAGFDKNKLTLVAVDRSKKETTHLTDIFDITRVPTIIVFKNGNELGRVVEYGKTGKYDEEVSDLIK